MSAREYLRGDDPGNEAAPRHSETEQHRAHEIVQSIDRTAVEPKPGVAIDFLSKWKPGGPWVLCAFHQDDRDDKQFATFGPDTLDELAKWITAQQAAKRNIYFHVNTVPAGIGRAKKTDVATLDWLHVDVDPEKGKDLAEEQKRILALLQTHDILPQPSVIIFSGGGYQGFWKLEEPIELNGELEKVEDAEQYNVQIQRLLMADACHNADRIMRLPGTVNWPNAKKRDRGQKPVVAELVHAEWGATYPIGEFVKAPVRGGDGAKPSRNGKSVPTVSVDQGNVQRIPPDALLETLAPYGIEDGDGVIVRIVHGHDNEAVPDSSRDRSRSGALFGVACELVRHRVPDPIIFSLLTDPNYGISAHAIAQGRGRDRAALRAIESAKKEVSSDTRSNIERAFAAKVDRLGVTLEYDEFTDQIRISGLEGFGPIFDDAAMLRLRLTFSTLDEDNKVPPKGMFKDLCENHCRYHSRHPVREYLDDVQDRWDGVSRVDTWLINYLGADDTKFNRAVGRIFLVAAVRRVRKPGCKFDELVVLEGEQGHGKSTILKRLAVNEDWFSDDLPLNADGKRVIEQTGGKWIIECGELKGMKRGDIEALKSTLSRTHDRARLAYDSIPSDVPRQWIGAGSTNNRKYLKDQTGNRRFWPVETGDIDLDGFTSEVVDQLWAEAATLETAGESIRLDPALYDDAAQVQSARTADDPIVEKLESVLDGLDDVCVTSDDLWTILGAPDATKRTQGMNDMMGETMRRLGFERKQRRVGGRRHWCYQRGESQEPPHVPARFTSKGVFVGWVGVDVSSDDGGDAF